MYRPADENYERVDALTPPVDRLPHRARYHIASGFFVPGDTVVDAACGTGYGALIMEARGPIDYLGVERDLSVLEVRPTPSRRFEAVDLEIWGGPPTPFDVAVIFETTEHLENPTALRDWTYRARRFVLVSVPIADVGNFNPFHRHNYRPADILGLWQNLKRYAYFEQPNEITGMGTGIWVFEQW